MKKFDTRTYSISDFIEWDNNGVLELSPDFQRRSVWTEKAKSYLIDTILRGKPMPKIIITQRLEGIKNIRVVVDGQQRLLAILGYYNGDFKISKAHNKELAQFTYDNLPDDLDKEFLKYELLFDTPYAEILDIFARINSYTVKLQPQEIYNAKYLGYFKQLVYSTGFTYVNYFIGAGILTKAQITRMAEANLSADLIVALVDKVQSNKSVEAFYKKYEDEHGGLEGITEKFDQILTYINELYRPEELKETNYSRVPLFYTLFTTIGHLIFGINGLDPQYQIGITLEHTGKIRVILDDISASYDTISDSINDPNYPLDFKEFINASRRGTTDSAMRIVRSNFLCNKIIKSL